MENSNLPSETANASGNLEGAKNDALIESQLKFCSTILTKMKKNANAQPFLVPVDPVLLNIPDYPEKIKHPMDISTIKSKLDNNVYSSPEEFHKDVTLMFNNCYTYNSPDIPVHQMGKELQRYFENLYADLPSDKKKKKVETPKQPVSSGAKRNSKPVESMPLDDYQHCSEVLADLEKPKHKKYSWPFLFPVSEKEVPGYLSIIKHPMDLSTIRQKLDNKVYASSDEFVADLNQIIENCFTFNLPDSEVYKCGEEFNKAIQALVNKGKDVETRIVELRKKISALTDELRTLEQQLSGKGIYSVTERERIGKAIVGMTKNQVEKVSDIVYRHCAYEYADNEEVEINLHTMPDEVVAEIDELIQKIKNGQGDAISSASDE